MKFHSDCACFTSRRAFLCGASAFGASAAVPVAKAQTRLRLDVHHHIFPRPVLDLQEKLNPAWGGPPLRGLKEWSPTIMIEALGRDGVAAAITSSPGAMKKWTAVLGVRTSCYAQAKWPGSRRREDDDNSAELDATVQVHRVLVGHPNASR